MHTSLRQRGKVLGREGKLLGREGKLLGREGNVLAEKCALMRIKPLQRREGNAWQRRKVLGREENRLADKSRKTPNREEKCSA